MSWRRKAARTRDARVAAQTGARAAAQTGARAAAQTGARAAAQTGARAAAQTAHDAGTPFAWHGALLACATLLVGIGVVMNYSTTAAREIGAAVPELAIRHWLGVLSGAVAAALCARIPLSFWRRIALPALLLCTLLLAATLALGIEANGARRWIALPGVPIRLQAAEPTRLALVLALASVLAGAMHRGAPKPAVLRAVAPMVLAPVLLLLLQPNFSGAGVLIALAGLLLFASGLPLRWFVAPGVLAVIGACGYVALRPYALARVRGFLDPWQSAQGEGFQLVQSFVAFGRGGPFGVGIGAGRQKLFFLPEAHTDFILSVVAEELGLVGVLLVIGAFAGIAVYGLRVARRAREPYALLVATGMTAAIVVPALLNAAVVMGLAPTTGLALPFLSHGSNSLICTGIALGILLRIAAHEAAPATVAPTGSRLRGGVA
ncbi:MAG TPA: putative peptidoglycan glycosyltransferase FtsW [Myxococcota bacterium]|nr:putative peptidoglycan glycosyltransferase FtsW [Myxococcota bacterium]